VTLPRIDELELHYQPIIDLESGGLAGAEALVRWRHPDRGLLLPRDFIGLCEETGFITDVGEWVLTEASRQIAAWNDGYPPSQRLWISINISARQLQSSGFASTIARAVHDTGIRDQLVVEIRGTVLLDGSSDMVEVLLAIQREGVRIALDDFASSYASRAHLKRFPITVLKIDRSFIADLPPERRSRLLAAASRRQSRTPRSGVWGRCLDRATSSRIPSPRPRSRSCWAPASPYCTVGATTAARGGQRRPDPTCMS
jgi:EAL domain-containing protein (putative c-di-GMP-specific phosphodiesterase class I)